MKKYITIIAAGLALAFTGLTAQETPDYAQIVEDTRAIEDRDAKIAAALSVSAEHGPDLFVRLENGETMTVAESVLLAWYADLSAHSGQTDAAILTGIIEHLDQISWKRWFFAYRASDVGVMTDALAAWIIQDNLIGFKGSQMLLSRKHQWSDLDLKKQLWFGLLESHTGTGQASGAWKRMFKNYRSTLTTSEQIAVTQKEKDGLIAVPSRSASQDKWLTEVSADLMALRLDQ